METSVIIREADLKEQIAYMKTILNEKQYRCYLGTTAISLGRGGQAMVARLSGSSINTVRKGIEEVRTNTGTKKTIVYASRVEAENPPHRRIPISVKQ